jgi:hypothetical protein
VSVFYLLMVTVLQVPLVCLCECLWVLFVDGNSAASTACVPL